MSQDPSTLDEIIDLSGQITAAVVKLHKIEHGAESGETRTDSIPFLENAIMTIDVELGQMRSKMARTQQKRDSVEAKVSTAKDKCDELRAIIKKLRSDLADAISEAQRSA